VLGSASEAEQDNVPVFEKSALQMQPVHKPEQSQSQAAEAVEQKEDEEKEPTVYLSCKSVE